jgi:hypothetical protein
MKVTYSGNQSLRAMLAERGVPTKDLGQAVDAIVKRNGLRSARGIPEGTVLDFPSTLTLGDSKVRLKKVVGDVSSRADSARSRPSGGRRMGSMGIFAFDDLRRGGAITACGPSTHPMYAGCAVSADTGDATPSRRRRASNSAVSGCGPSTHPMYSSGCVTSACSGGSTPTSTTRRRRASSNAVSGCGPSTHPMYSNGCG